MRVYGDIPCATGGTAALIVYAKRVLSHQGGIKFMRIVLLSLFRYYPGGAQAQTHGITIQGIVNTEKQRI
jgi:hypothetical protein